MKVRISITIDSGLDKEIRRMIEREIEIRTKNVKNAKEIRKIIKELSYSSVVERLIRKGIAARRIGL